MKSSLILEKFQRLSGLQHLLLGLIIVFIISFFSEGFYHPDEHFVLLEWIDLVSDFSLRPDITQSFEFQQAIRPWIQVVIFATFYKIFLFFGLASPFLLAFFLRFLTGVMGLWVLMIISKNYKNSL